MDDKILDMLVEMAGKLGSAETKADTAHTAIRNHTDECLQFRSSILGKIEENRVAAENRHSDLVKTLTAVGRSQDKLVIRVGGAIITLMLGGFGTLLMLWLNTYILK